jgi:hypothetical protein
MLLFGVFGAEGMKEKIKNDVMLIIKNYIFATLLMGWSIKTNYRVNESMIANM